MRFRLVEADDDVTSTNTTVTPPTDSGASTETNTSTDTSPKLDEKSIDSLAENIDMQGTDPARIRLIKKYLKAVFPDARKISDSIVNCVNNDIKRRGYTPRLGDLQNPTPKSLGSIVQYLWDTTEGTGNGGKIPDEQFVVIVDNLLNQRDKGAYKSLRERRPTKGDANPYIYQAYEGGPADGNGGMYKFKAYLFLNDPTKVLRFFDTEDPLKDVRGDNKSLEEYINETDAKEIQKQLSDKQTKSGEDDRVSLAQFIKDKKLDQRGILYSKAKEYYGSDKYAQRAVSRLQYLMTEQPRTLETEYLGVRDDETKFLNKLQGIQLNSKEADAAYGLPAPKARVYDYDTLNRTEQGFVDRVVQDINELVKTEEGQEVAKQWEAYETESNKHNAVASALKNLKGDYRKLKDEVLAQLRFTATGKTGEETSAQERPVVDRETGRRVSPSGILY